MQELAQRWSMGVDRGPDWIFVRLHPPADLFVATASLAEDVWQVMQQHLATRIVLELDQVPLMTSYVIGQLVLLNKRICGQGGIMRVCGLSEANRQVLRATRLENCFPNFDNRGDAVMGHRPLQPR